MKKIKRKIIIKKPKLILRLENIDKNYYIKVKIFKTQ